MRDIFTWEETAEDEQTCQALMKKNFHFYEFLDFHCTFFKPLIFNESWCNFFSSTLAICTTLCIEAISGAQTNHFLKESLIYFFSKLKVWFSLFWGQKIQVFYLFFSPDFLSFHKSFLLSFLRRRRREKSTFVRAFLRASNLGCGLR